ncbi:MAG: 4Fe-4S dicluster domain-containing protein [Spirochaetes bacterium]|nr:4Fe-4S dicluster domain-containing protein [Spirochaetota bacterium]MBU1078865.1 4Fe-4S dicluster domain-containing protein [Spirochaetota bacterium]
MAHASIKSSYAKLAERLNRFPQGAPPSDLLFAILRVLFDEKEAELVSLLPIKPFRAERAALAWRTSPSEAKKTLDELASRALLIDTERDGETTYCLPPPMAGFFEFSMMRMRSDLDQKALAELFYQYLNVEEDFIKSLFTDGDTQLGRVFVQEPMLPKEAAFLDKEARSSVREPSPADNALLVLDYERASEVIKTASHIGVGMCYCRHKMTHLGRACDAPLDICMTFNSSAESLTRHGHARAVGVSECMGLLDTAYERGLVQFGENVQRRVNFICNCCGCCCEALVAQRRFGLLHPVHTTNYMPSIAIERCAGCGMCVDACPVEAVALVSAEDPRRPKRRKAEVREDSCLGCGLCVRACPTGALSLRARAERVFTPVDSTHRAVLMAIERGKLQNLVFDNGALSSHRAMAAILGVILRLPPVKRLMASEQMRSKYLVRLLSTVKA